MDRSLLVSATVDEVSSAVTLHWPAAGGVTSYDVYWRPLGTTSWSSGGSVPGTAISYPVTNVGVGEALEFIVLKRTADYTGFGYIYTGVKVPLVEQRGTVVLIVDQTHSVALSNELSRLESDLVGDGWTVQRHDVSPSATPPEVKALILADHAAAPTQVRSVFLVGHVPVPYSGELAPDEHYSHLGAWPADLYYGDVDGVWTDSTVNRTTASDARNDNIPGDGKFDQSDLPSDVELEVGRVDFANLPAFAKSEVELLRQYLNKHHAFRHGQLSVERRGLVDDHLGLLGGEAPAANGWRNFAPMFGAANTVAADWQTTLSSQSYLWAYGCGSGTFTSCAGVTTTSALASSDPRVVFTMMLGSYFGDWDSSNNLLRSVLATPSYTLTAAWVGRPSWFVHPMALGKTIGFGARASQNNGGAYTLNPSWRKVHTALMGDPTLRMHPVVPPSGLVVNSNGSGGADLSWVASTDPEVLGYHVYSAPSMDGSFTRLNSDLISGTSYTHPTGGDNLYMVRAVKLEVSGSGSYFNASQGVFADLGTLPTLTITALDTNKVFGAPLPGFTALYEGFVNGDTTNDLDSQAVFSTTATAASPVGTYPITVSGATSPNYFIQFVEGTLTIDPAATTGTVTASANPVLPGTAVTLTLSVASVAPGAGTPTGDVQFVIDGAPAGSLVPLTGGQAQYTTSALAVGTHTISAEYAGEANFIGTTNDLAMDLLVNTPPVAGTDTVERDAGSGVKVAIETLLSNDTDDDGDLIQFLAASALSANGGTVLSNDNWIYYTPAPDFTNGDSFNYTISDGRGAPIEGLVMVAMRVDDGPSSNLTIIDQGGGSFLIRGDGIPGRTYRIEFTEDVLNPDWQQLGTATADPAGHFEYVDSNGSVLRFYRSAYP